MKNKTNLIKQILRFDSLVNRSTRLNSFVERFGQGRVANNVSLENPNGISPYNIIGARSYSMIMMIKEKPGKT